MELLYRLGWTLLQSLWQGAMIAVVLAVVLPALARWSAQARYVALIAAMVALLMAFVVTFVCGPIRDFPSPLRTIAVSAAPAPTHSQARAVDPAIGPAAAPILTIPSPQRPAERPVSSARWTGLFHQTDWLCQAAGQAWLIGVLLLGAWRALAWFSVRRLVVLKSSPADANISQTARRLALRLELCKRFEILISCLAETPMVIGWLRPIILIPAAAVTGLSPAQLEAILAHELAHIRRHDYLVNLLQILVETLLFYHPAIWWISRRMRLEREQACDDIAVSMCGDRQAYARSLAAVEELRMFGSPALAARGTGGKQMLLRIRRILRPMDATPRSALSGLICFVLIAVVGLVICRRMLADTPKGDSATENRQSVWKAANGPAASPNGDNDRPNPPAAPATGPSASDSIFKFDVPFQHGKTDFLDGDRITITDVRGTSSDMESGICCISGTYKLTSHVQAMLAAFVTAADSSQGIGSYNAAQTVNLHKGTGTFTLLLPIDVKGWPHVSFYGKETAPASQPTDSAEVKRKIDYLNQDLQTQERALGRNRKELDALAEKYGTADLQSRDQQMQAQLAAIEANLQQAKIALQEAEDAKKTDPASTEPADKERVCQQIAAVDMQMAANLRFRENLMLTVQGLKDRGLGARNPMVETAQQNYQDAQKRVEDYAADYLDKHEGKIPDNVAASTQRVKSLQKMVDQTRLPATEIGSQRQAIEDVRAEIVQIRASRDRDIHSIEELNARQVIESGLPDLTQHSFGEIYIGIGDWVLRK